MRSRKTVSTPTGKTPLLPACLLLLGSRLSSPHLLLPLTTNNKDSKHETSTKRPRRDKRTGPATQRGSTGTRKSSQRSAGTRPRVGQGHLNHSLESGSELSLDHSFPRTARRLKSNSPFPSLRQLNRGKGIRPEYHCEEKSAKVKIQSRRSDSLDSGPSIFRSGALPPGGVLRNSESYS